MISPGFDKEHVRLHTKEIIGEKCRRILTNNWIISKEIVKNRDY